MSSALPHQRLVTELHLPLRMMFVGSWPRAWSLVGIERVVTRQVVWVLGWIGLRVLGRTSGNHSFWCVGIVVAFNFWGSGMFTAGAGVLGEWSAEGTEEGI